MIFLFAFIGGLCLNFLPCVFPTLALKATRGPWFAAGMISVFMALATLNVAFGMAWGQQYESQPFAIAMVGLTFVMGLSLLGVWEIPSFGFRGEYGTFAKGALATLLSTACSGPFLGPVFAATLGQHPATVYAIFACIGAGMALPYVVPIPLPAPGAWMISFKQLGGWLLMGTTIWLLRSVELIFPTLVMLLILGAACTYRRFLLVAPLIAALFLWTPTQKIEWKDYNPYLVQADKITMIQFTARYCIACQINEAVLDSVAEDIKQRGVVTLRAELKGEGGQAGKLLRSLGYNSVPVLAIFHPDGRRIVLPDLITRGQVIEALQ